MDTVKKTIMRDRKEVELDSIKVDIAQNERARLRNMRYFQERLAVYLEWCEDNDIKSIRYNKDSTDQYGPTVIS